MEKIEENYPPNVKSKQYKSPNKELKGKKGNTDKKGDKKEIKRR